MRLQAQAEVFAAKQEGYVVNLGQISPPIQHIFETAVKNLTNKTTKVNGSDLVSTPSIVENTQNTTSSSVANTYTQPDNVDHTISLFA
jgi:hypothetical protein